LGMVLRIQRIGDGFGVMIPPEMVEELGLKEGDLVKIEVPEKVRTVGCECGKKEMEYASDEEVVEAFLATEPEHRNSYRELAK
jgi:antitoxin component of MazEF toxin-antitoxin module